MKAKVETVFAPSSIQGPNAIRALGVARVVVWRAAEAAAVRTKPAKVPLRTAGQLVQPGSAPMARASLTSLRPIPPVNARTK
jgi:hypothetical protein